MRKKILKIFILVAAIFMAAVFMVKGILRFTQKPTDVSKGVKILKEMETKNIGEVEQQVQLIQTQAPSASNEKEDTGESANSQNNEEGIVNRNYKEIFANSVVMGDSIAEALGEYNMLNSSSLIAEMGVSLTALDGALATVTQLSPQNVFLYYGFNDIGHVWDDYDRFRDEYESFIVKLKQALPDAKTYANSLFPVLNLDTIGNAFYADVSPYNQIIKEICEQYDIAYLDNTGLVKDEYYAEDGYHFKSDFYPYWLNSMAQGAGL